MSKQNEIGADPMAVRTYSVKKDGDRYVSKNFKVKEFASKDGADSVLIDSTLVDYLQMIRSHFGKPVSITSGYRTKEYNAKVGGTSSSNHTKGIAADIQVAGVNPVIVGMYAQTIGVGGIGLYAYVAGGFVHIDTRAQQYRWLTLSRGAAYQQQPRIMPTIKQGVTSANPTNAVRLLQRRLGLTESGTFGGLTTDAVKQFQKYSGLTVDGIVGQYTWRALFS